MRASERESRIVGGTIESFSRNPGFLLYICQCARVLPVAGSQCSGLGRDMWAALCDMRTRACRAILGRAEGLGRAVEFLF